MPPWSAHTPSCRNNCTQVVGCDNAGRWQSGFGRTEVGAQCRVIDLTNRIATGLSQVHYVRHVAVPLDHHGSGYQHGYPDTRPAGKSLCQGRVERRLNARQLGAVVADDDDGSVGFLGAIAQGSVASLLRQARFHQQASDLLAH